MTGISTTLMPDAYSYGTGGNSATVPFSETGFASIGFMVICVALVMMMTPFVGLLYSGLSTTRNGLSSYLICMTTYSIVAVQWVLFGYSLAFAEDSSSSFIGNFNWGALKGIGGQGLLLTAPAIPAILFALYQMQFATITAAIIFGSVVERIRFIPSMIFIFIWATIVYDPIAYWTWGARGWLKNLSCLSTTAIGSIPCQIGVMDFAGGGPVEICSGTSALALTFVIGHRKRRGVAHNLINVNVATGLLWFGWYGFNAGSALSASPRAGMAAMTTTIAAAMGSISWVLIDYRRSRKVTSLAYCSGALAGLVAITPACGFVSPWAAIVIGLCAGCFCRFICSMKEFGGYDDSLDAFGVHGGGGFIGLLLTGIFADPAVIALDGTVSSGGVINANYIQLGYQAVAAVSVMSWSFIVTYLLAKLFSFIPALSLRCSDEVEYEGIDKAEMNERAYELEMARAKAASYGNLLTLNPAAAKDPSAMKVDEIKVQKEDKKKKDKNVEVSNL